MSQVADLSDQVASISWYHTLELPGIVTPGRWDLRGVPSRLPIPDLKGKRCLDVGTWDGFWAFEMERRGAEVVAIDLRDASRWDWPASRQERTLENWTSSISAYAGFDLAHTALQSRVERRELSIYDLDPSDIGTFDFAFVGSIIPHLRDPAGGFMALRSVVTGSIISADQVSLSLTLLRPGQSAADLTAKSEPHWWTPNMACRKQLLRAAGFEPVKWSAPYRLKPGPGAPRPPLTFRGLVSRTIGVPHAWILAE